MWVRRPAILAHRYLGIPLSALFVVWFASGIVMMYAGAMPALTPQARLARLPALDLAGIRVSPADAVAAAGLERTPAQIRLLTVLDRPAYRVGSATVFADTGEPLEPLSGIDSRRVAARFSATTPEAVALVGTITEPDQWTIGLARQLPLHRYRLDDGARTEVYVSPRLGEVVLETTRSSRLLAWLGAIPHWLYFTALRTQPLLWSRIVIWLSTLGSVLAVLGLILAVTQWRVRYAGAMRWHYVTGLVFGVFTITWVFSGLLSMEPYAWTTASGLDIPREALSGGPPDLARYPSPDAWGDMAAGRAIKEIEFANLQDRPHFIATLGGGERVIVAADGLVERQQAFSVDSIVSRIERAVPETPVDDVTMLSSYDAYYYARDGARPLPVVRIKFADPAETWIYVDPEFSQVVGSVHRASRVERWLYRGLHSLDFAFWYDRRPLWDAGLILLSVGGLVSSGVGFWIGARRVARWIARGTRVRPT